MTPATDTVLCLRTCKADMTSHSGFVWPREGDVACEDWSPAPHCGNGLHGLAWGEGQGDLLLSTEADAVWLIFEAAADCVVGLGGKVKVPSATVVKCGGRDEVLAWLVERAPGRAVYRGTATAGYAGTATAGDDGTATAGYAGTATAGTRGTATAGYAGTATAGYAGTATAGDDGTATAGYAGTATAGTRGTATAGDDGTATAGYAGTILLRRWNGKRYRWTLGEIGESTDATGTVLAANVAYKLNSDGQFVKAVSS